MKKIIISLVLLSLFFAVLFISINMTAPKVLITTSSNFFDLKVLISDNPQKRAHGLTILDSINDKLGMYFIFEKDTNSSFWMKDMKFPIDIIFIDKESRVVSIFKNVQPCKNEPCELINPGIDYRYVLETNAGYSERKNIKTGDSISLSR